MICFVIRDRCGDEIFPLSFMRFRMLLISVVSEIKDKHISIPMDQTCARKVNANWPSVYVIMAVNKNPIGFFQSNGNL